MSLKDLFGFGEKKNSRNYDYPYEDDGYPRSGPCTTPGQYSAKENQSPVGKRSLPFSTYSPLNSIRCPSEEIPVAKVISVLYPETQNTKSNNTTESHVETDSAQNNLIARPALSKPKKLVILLFENTKRLSEYKDIILQTTNQILATQKDSLFLPLELGKTYRFFELSDYSDIVSNNILNQILGQENHLECANLPSAFIYMNKYLRDKTWPRFEFKDVICRISSCDIICIGNRCAIDIAISNPSISRALTEISQRIDIKLFKYLCFLSADTVKVISLNLDNLIPGFFSLVKPKTKDVIVIVVENTHSVINRKKAFITLLDQITSNQKNALYLLVKVGTTNKYTPLIDFEELSCNKLLLDLFDVEISTEETKLAYALEHIKNILVPMNNSKFSFKNQDYLSSSFSFVCIGSGSARIDETSKTMVANCIQTFTSWEKTKNLKYLCVSDHETIKAAALGFPDIKHIISDFYN